MRQTERPLGGFGNPQGLGPERFALGKFPQFRQIMGHADAGRNGRQRGEPEIVVGHGAAERGDLWPE
ncbi:MAG TPA: hypothetical protein VHN13_07865 [Candidatus Tectomicrobia bacterium]|nr:hypothetical protein [Candidatus Tectomicrobia bacterium]